MGFAEVRTMKIYPLGIVGESNYQASIAKCRQGESVQICHETENPFDPQALRVENFLGKVIGYIPKDCWLRDAIHDQGRGCAATIKDIMLGDSGIYGVVLDVTLTDDTVNVRKYK
jgi:hypothetical protein